MRLFLVFSENALGSLAEMSLPVKWALPTGERTGYFLAPYAPRSERFETDTVTVVSSGR
jgi:hypothetical protein